MEKEKKVLHITINKAKKSKTKINYWWYWKIKFPFWYIWRPKVVSKFYWLLSEAILKLIPVKSQREKLRKEYEEIDVLIDEESLKKIKQAMTEFSKNSRLEL